jgi:hypothetical protein
MKHLVALKFVFSLLHIAAAGSIIPSYFRPVTVTPRDLSSAQVQRDLGCRLSNTTTIIGATSNDFTAATVRWSNFHQPTIQIVVEPGKESDVSKIVSTILWSKWEILFS